MALTSASPLDLHIDLPEGGRHISDSLDGARLPENALAITADLRTDREVRVVYTLN
jgi:hypothetical protein